jgi:hypothetical protein
MASIITIILFFVYTWGLGFSATYWLRKSANFLERTIMNIGLGLGVFAILSIILNTLSVPLDWRIFLLISLIIPGYHLYKAKKISKPDIKITKVNIAIFLAIFIFAVSFYVYASGSFGYPYLENEDPWGHSVGVHYVSEEKTAFDPTYQQIDQVDRVLSYIDPYPPAYDILLGVLQQTANDIRWTMKFFNSLIISLGILFFFFFVRRFVQNPNKALLATFFLAAIPSYLSHFIWAHSLVITLIFPAMYAFILIKQDNKWMYVAATMVAAIWVSQNLSQPIKISMMILLYLIVYSVANQKFFTKGFIAFFAGIALSFFWWGAVLKKYGLQKFIAVWQPRIAAAGAETVASTSLWSKLLSVIKAIFDAGGTGSRAYTFNDFFYANGQNMINNPIGIGVFLSLLTIVGVLFLIWHYRGSLISTKNYAYAVALFWLIFTFWGINGITFPISIARGSFRVWMLMAIPLAIVAVEGVYFIKSLCKSKILKQIVMVIIIIGVIFTSAMAKEQLNTSAWPSSGVFAHPQHVIELATWMEEFPEGTRMFMFDRNKIVIGYGKDNCIWCEDEILFRADIENKTPEEVHTFLKSKKYEYLLLNIPVDIKHFRNMGGADNVEQRVEAYYNNILNSGLFTPVYQKEGFMIALKIK